MSLLSFSLNPSTQSSVVRVLTIAMTAGAMLATTLSAQAQDSHNHANSSKITFDDDKYCGQFTGDIYDGKSFHLWLNKNQELIIYNKGTDQISIAYVDGPSNRLTAERYEKVSSFLTDSKGNHYIKLYGTSRNSSVKFCAY